MTLPESGWAGHGRPGFLCEAAKKLRAAAIEADDQGHDLREVAFRSWLIRCPDKAAEALIALETALVSERRL
jgi:hypothetical protein